MFQNIGKKIRTLAKVICWVGIIVSIVGGVVMAASGAALMDYDAGSGVAAIVGGIVTAVFGALFSWIGSFMMLGFGEIVDRVNEIAENTRPQYGRNSEF